MQALPQNHMFENLNLCWSCRDLGGCMYSCRRWITRHGLAGFVTNLYFLSCSNFSHHTRKCSYILLLSWSLSFMHSMQLFFFFLKSWGEINSLSLEFHLSNTFMIIKVTNTHAHTQIGSRSWIVSWMFGPCATQVFSLFVEWLWNRLDMLSRKAPRKL